MRKGPFVAECVGEGAVQRQREGRGVARLLVEEEDAFAGAAARAGTGRRRWTSDLRGEPFGGFADAFERVAAVDVPGDAAFAAGFAAAGPLDLFEAALEFGGEGGGGEGAVAENAEVVGGDFDGEAGVGFLEVGG